MKKVNAMKNRYSVIITRGDGTPEKINFSTLTNALIYYNNLLLQNRDGERHDAAATVRTAAGAVIKGKTF